MEQQYKPRPPVTTGSPQRALHRTRPLQPPSIDRARLTVGGADTVLWLQRQAGNSVVAAALGPVVQRRIRPEDLAGDLAGLPFALGGDLTIGAVTLAAGDEVTVVSW